MIHFGQDAACKKLQDPSENQGYGQLSFATIFLLPPKTSYSARSVQILAGEKKRRPEIRREPLYTG